MFWIVEERRNYELHRLTVVIGTEAQFRRVLNVFGYAYVDDETWFVQTSVPGWTWYIEPITEAEYKHRTK